MNTYAPDYYHEFKCIADKCTHSCCVGWEIDIDSHTLDYYESLGGSIGERLCRGISYEDEPHFILESGDRCPFLNQTGLCDLICELGEDALCDICADHPRFRNYYSDSVELGLGLCCEAAGRLILQRTQPFKLVALNTVSSECSYSHEERYVLNMRDKLIAIMQDRSMTIEERLRAITRECGVQMPEKSIAEWCDYYMTLEILSSDWTDALNLLKNTHNDEFMTDDRLNIALEQLTVYFLYRHMTPCTSDICTVVKFAVLSCSMIWALWSISDTKDMESLIQYARMYSSEIEYSDENLDSIFMELSFL